MTHKKNPVLALVLAALWLAICFTPASAQETLTAIALEGGAPIGIRIDGMPDPVRKDLTGQIAEKAWLSGIKISADAAGEYAYQLEGVSAAAIGLDGTSVMILWLLSRADGAPVESFTAEVLIENRAPDDPWSIARGEVIVDLAGQTVEVIAALAPVAVSDLAPLERDPDAGPIPERMLGNIILPTPKPLQETEVAAVVETTPRINIPIPVPSPGAPSAPGTGTVAAAPALETAAVENNEPVETVAAVEADEPVETAMPAEPVEVAEPVETEVTAEIARIAEPAEQIQSPVPTQKPEVVPEPKVIDTPTVIATVVPSNDPTPVLVGLVSGAPGDGNERLSLSMFKELSGRGLPMVSGSDSNWYTITADVELTPQGDTDNIVIVWSVVNAVGNPLGQVRQENSIPPGMLAPTWGENAELAARDAAEGILTLLRQAGETY